MTSMLPPLLVYVVILVAYSVSHSNTSFPASYAYMQDK